MTTVTIQSGACGFSTTVTVEKTKDGKLAISVETECGMVEKMCGRNHGSRPVLAAHRVFEQSRVCSRGQASEACCLPGSLRYF